MQVSTVNTSRGQSGRRGASTVMISSAPLRAEPPSTARLTLWSGVLGLPLCGLYLLLAHPELDSRWEMHPAHFWLVLAVASSNFAIGGLMSEAARRRKDARVFLIAIALLTSAGFLALHALATPGVLMPG